MQTTETTKQPLESFQSFKQKYDQRHREGLARNKLYSVGSLRTVGFASYETECFHSRLLCQGIEIATVTNAGQGGPDNIQYDENNWQENERKFEAYARDCGFEDGEDMYAALHAQHQDLKRQAKSAKKQRQTTGSAAKKTSAKLPAAARSTVKVLPVAQSQIDNPYRVNGVGCRDIFAAEAQVKLQKQVKGGPAIVIMKGGAEIKMTSFQSMCSVARRQQRTMAS
jgi:hypothetical protein